MPPRILIVEDEALIAGDLMGRLATMGYVVAGVAATGQEGVHLAQQTHPDLVLMDVILKGDMDGIEAARQIKTAQTLPIIFLSAYSDLKTLNRTKAVEAYSYILKPYTERELHMCIEVALYKHRADEKFKKLSRWFTATVASNGDGVIISDLDGRIVYINKTAETLTGWSLDEAMGKPFFEVFHVIHQGRRQLVGQDLSKLFQEGGMLHLGEDWILKSKDGRDIIIDDSAVPVWSKNDQTIGGAIVFRDATARIQIETELQHAEALQSVGKLVAGLDPSIP
jgi:PAS domain S-box-containing protein